MAVSFPVASYSKLPTLKRKGVNAADHDKKQLRNASPWRFTVSVLPKRHIVTEMDVLPAVEMAESYT
jgi:hypothetical protein